MNHRYRPAPRSRPQPAAARSIAATAVLVVALVGSASPVLAQTRALPADLKTAADVKPRVAQIQTFITAQVTALANEKSPTDQQRARDALANECSNRSGPPSASFIDAYTGALSSAIQPLAKSPSIR